MQSDILFDGPAQHAVTAEFRSIVRAECFREPALEGNGLKRPDDIGAAIGEARRDREAFAGAIVDDREQPKRPEASRFSSRWRDATHRRYQVCFW